MKVTSSRLFFFIALLLSVSHVNQGFANDAELDPAKAVTVHLYRTGSGHDRASTYLDGKEMLKLHNHQIVTVYLAPGYHEISVNYGRQQPTVGLRSKAGEEFFVELRVDVRFSAIYTNPENALHVELSKEEGIADHDKLHEERLKPQEINAIFEMSRDLGFDPEQQPTHSPHPVVSLLTDDEVQNAILNGIHNESPNSIGLYLNDVGTNFASHVLADGAYANSGFSVILYTPKRWIEYQASMAHRLLKPFALADVTPEMRQNVLRIVALPRIPDRLDGAGMASASSVARVVICDKSKQNIIQPLNERASALTIDSALRSKDYTAIASNFDMADLNLIRQADKDGEFYAVVIGADGSRKFFDIKSKFSGWL